MVMISLLEHTFTGVQDDWLTGQRLQNKVIDIEVANSTPSPTVDPSVHTILIGHSMGGIVAAETVLLLENEQLLPSSKTIDPNFPSNTTLNSTTGTSHPTYNQNDRSNTTSATSSTYNTTPMFPRITGILAFDTPFLGISPGVIAHGAEGHYKTASTAYTAFTELGSAFGWGAASKSGSKSPRTPPKSSQSAGLLTNGSTSSTGDAAATPRWQSWGKYAMFAGAAGAVAAGGAAALYSQREKLSSGWGWVSGHLEFVGCLLRGEELTGRIEKVGALSRREENITGTLERTPGNGNGFAGSANFYTVLGRGADSNDTLDSGTKLVLDSSIGKTRTFCKLPPSVLDPKTKSQRRIDDGAEAEQRQGMKWIPAVNDKSGDEITAHVSMFYPRENPGFYNLGEKAKEVVGEWVMTGDKEWYDTSSKNDGSGKGKTYGEVGDDGWEKPDYEGDEGVKEKVREKERSVGMAEPVWVDGEEEDVRMREGSADAEDLESSVVVDKAT